MKTLAQLLLGVVQSVINTLSTLLGGLLVSPGQQQRKEFSVDVVRPDDLLVATLDFYNLVKVTPGGGRTRLEMSGPGDAFIVLRMPPQSFAEQAFFETNDPSTTEPAGAPPVGSRMAGASQVVFRIAVSELPLKYSLESILATLTRSAQVVSTRIAQPPGVPGVDGTAFFGGLRGQFTAVEAPWRLVLSPSSLSRWEHAAKAAAASTGRRVELWHTRLSAESTARAVFSPDYVPAPGKAPDANTIFPFLMSLREYDRHRLVRVTADPALPGRRSADVDFLALSSLGAWLNIHGQWDTSLGLAEWRHLLTMGRDEYVRVVDEGVLFETGHRAVLLTITERKIELIKNSSMEGSPGAYLRQWQIIIVREPTKTYGHRHVPFRRLTIKNLVTPKLEKPASSQIGTQGELAFWPRVSTGGVAADFQFHLIGVDWEGRAVEYHKPLAFIAKTLHDDLSPVDLASLTTKPGVPATNPPFIKALVARYNSAPDARRNADFGGQGIAFAPAKTAGDTTLRAASLSFGALDAGGWPRFLPGMTTADVDVPDARNLTGQATPSRIAFEPSFLASSGDVIGNASDVFARLVTKSPLALPKEKTGGLVAPNLDISGLSRTLGPVGGDVGKMVAGQFRPLDIFGDVTILGGIKLSAILRDLDFGYLDKVGTQVPNLKSVRLTKGGKEVIETSYRWKLDASGLVTAGMFTRNDDSQFYIETVVDQPLDGSPADMTVSGGLTKFSVVLLPGAPLVGLNFDSITFAAKKDAKVDVSIEFKGFEFLGTLSFVNKLKDVIPLDGFKDPPYLDIVLPPEPRPGISAGFTLAIPTVGIGIFTLANISFSAGFDLPLLSDPANLRLAFCTREQPFTLTVSLFGGGGFFAIDIGMAGVTQIEAALEFGAAIALNLGVAEGGVSIMGGVYYQKSGAGFALSAYVRANGSLEVLGIITVSVEFYIALNYESDKGAPHGGQLWGQASLKVKVKIAFFSKSVTLTVERDFAGSDPTFADSLTPADWSEYCAAFDDYAA